MGAPVRFQQPNPQNQAVLLTNDVVFFHRTSHYLQETIERFLLKYYKGEVKRVNLRQYAGQIGHLGAIAENQDSFTDQWVVHKTMVKAALNGHLHILQWFHRPPHKDVISAAAKGGHLPILQWYLLEDVLFEYHDDTVAHLAAKGDLTTIQWLHDHCTFQYTNAINDSDQDSGGSVESHHDQNSSSFTPGRLLRSNSLSSDLTPVSSYQKVPPRRKKLVKSAVAASGLCVLGAKTLKGVQMENQELQRKMGNCVQVAIRKRST